MKRLLILLSCCGVFSSCYKDKGNYNVKVVNDFEITILPQSPNAEHRYTFNQPANDTAYYEFRADVQQTQNIKDNDNLSFVWYRSFNVDGKTINDTVRTPNLVLKFPPFKKSGYTLTCQVTDRNTGVSYYRFITAKTKVPYVNSWVLLHGQAGDRRLGAVEFDEEGNVLWSNDIYEGLLGVRRFQNFTTLMYSPLSSNWTKPERLFVASQDSCVPLHPFDLSLVSPLNTMMPPGLGNPKVAFTISNDVQAYSCFVDVKGKFYNGRQGGFFYHTPFESGLENYRVDKGYISSNGNATLWDDVSKKLMYYRAGLNYYGRDGVRNDAGITEKLKEVPETVLPKNELTDKIVLWLGRGTASTDEEESAMIVAKDNAGMCILYYLSFDEEDSGSGASVKLKKVNLGRISFDLNTRFATSNAYNGQLFYTKGSELYLYNINSGTEDLVYDAGGIIKNIKFRIYNNHYLGVEDAKVIGLVATKSNKMNFQEVKFSNSGDVLKSVVVEEDIEEISDFVFTHIQRRIL